MRFFSSQINKILLIIIKFYSHFIALSPLQFLTHFQANENFQKMKMSYLHFRRCITVLEKQKFAKNLQKASKF